MLHSKDWRERTQSRNSHRGRGNRRGEANNGKRGDTRGQDNVRQVTEDVATEVKQTEMISTYLAQGTLTVRVHWNL